MELIRVQTADLPAEADHRIDDAGALAMARAAVNLFRKWQITDAEACTLLGGMSESKYNRWKRHEIGRLGVDLRTRLSILMGIHKALRLLFTENVRAYAWVKTPNSHFGEQRPLDIMLRGQITDLFRVRQYLDAARG